MWQFFCGIGTMWAACGIFLQSAGEEEPHVALFFGLDQREPQVALFFFCVCSHA